MTHYIGDRFGRLVVLGFHHKSKWKVHVLCRCDCGTEKIFSTSDLKSGRVHSCGCLSREIQAERTKNKIKHTHLHYIYLSMKKRCFSPKTASYKDYGGRGISMCKEWADRRTGYRTFEKWALENGYSRGLSIDRINNDGNYYGGAIYSKEVPNCFAINCTFIGNLAFQGGAIAYGAAINSNFTSNHAKGAGGGAIYEGNATNCNFTHNDAIRGGAIYNGTATNCRFNQNEVTIDGGAIYIGNATECTFTDNKAEYGAGMHTGIATNCTFTNNAAENIGGAALCCQL